MQSFRTLKVWQKSHELTLNVYRSTADFPKGEVFGLTNQLRRSAASIAANIAEGCGRGSNPELRRFLFISMGSACETENHLLLAHDLGYLTTEIYTQLHNQTEEIKKMLSSLISKL